MLKVMSWMALIVWMGALSAQAHAVSWFDDYEPEVVVADPYLEVRTGPGRGFPVFYVAAEGDRITILKSKTQWYKVRVHEPREKEGWVHVRDLQNTLNLDGTDYEL